MKLKRLTGKRKTGKGRIAAVLALAVLLGAAPAIKTQAVDLTGSIQVNKPDVKEDGTFTELKDLDVSVDYYLVAKAKGLEGYDAYEFVWKDEEAAWTSPFIDLETEWEKALEDETVTSEEVSGFTQKLADKVLATVPAYMSGDTAGASFATPVTGKLGEQVKLDPTGLYLAIAHGDLEDYKGVPAEGEVEQLFTVAESATKLYEFLPMLISVPTRDDPERIEDAVSILGQSYPIEIGNTAADAGDWVNDVEMTAKVGEKDRVGNLTITKNLPTYKTKEGKVIPATFVFNIKATYNGKTVYKNVDSLKFDGTKTSDTIEIKDLPIGSVVTVKELYTGGGNYTLDTDNDLEILIDKEETTAEFTNIPGNSSHGGGSVKNSFSMGEIHWNTPEQDYANEEGSASTKTE
ncbi:MAG: hypothetical protein IJ121_02105 [Eubacterium sp.]|nr:hypothetical protein [Eubacterium sp.]